MFWFIIVILIVINWFIICLSTFQLSLGNVIGNKVVYALVYYDITVENIMVIIIVVWQRQVTFDNSFDSSDTITYICWLIIASTIIDTNLSFN